MAHIQSTYAKLWKPQSLTADKIHSKMMFIDNIDALESFALSVLKRSNAPVASLDELRAINTSDTILYTTGMTVMVKSNGLYFFDRANTDQDDGNIIITPITGGGRWISDRKFLSALAFKESLVPLDVGLGNVPNVATNDQTPTYTQSATLVNLTSGEKLSVSMGKIMKAIADLISHIANKSNPHSVTKNQVGLSNVDNTSDMDKPISNAVQEALNLLSGGSADQLVEFANHKNDISNPHGVTKAQVGLGNVPNVATNDQTPTYTEATTLATLTSGEKLSVSFGKIMKAITNLISHLANKSNPHNVTKTQVELGNVPNVTTNDQTPTYTQASTLATLTSGEKLSVSMGKIMKAIADLISHIANKSNPHGVTASNIGALPVTFSSNNTSTNEDDLDAILSNTINAMIDNSTRVIRVNFSMQHEHFVSGITAVMMVFRVSSTYGCAVAFTCSSGYPEVFIKGLNSGIWGAWRNAAVNTMSVASVE